MRTSGAEPRPVRAVVYGVGEMGSIVTRLLVERGVQDVFWLNLVSALLTQRKPRDRQRLGGRSAR